MCGRQHNARRTFGLSTVRDPGQDCRRRSENDTESVRLKGLLNNSTPSRFSKNPQSRDLSKELDKTRETYVSVSGETLIRSRG